LTIKKLFCDKIKNILSQRSFSMNRREKRKMKKEINIFLDIVNIIKQYFPQLVEKLEKLTDTRHQSYVEYKMSVITVTRLLGLLC